MVASSVAEPAFPPETRLPGLTRCRADAARQRCADRGEFEIQSSPLQRCLSLNDLRLRILHRLDALLEICLGRRTVLQQVSRAVVFLLRQRGLGPRAGQPRLDFRHRGDEGARVDAEQHVATLHHLAIGEGDAVEIAADPGVKLGFFWCWRSGR